MCRPALSSVLILASSASSSLVGNFLVLVYAVGFILPFLLLGLFTTQALNFLRNHKKLVKYTVKTGGIILIIMGVMTFTGWMNGISGYLNSFVPDKTLTNNDRNTENKLRNSRQMHIPLVLKIQLKILLTILITIQMIA